MNDEQIAQLRELERAKIKTSVHFHTAMAALPSLLDEVERLRAAIEKIWFACRIVDDHPSDTEILDTIGVVYSCADDALKGGGNE